MEKTIAFFIAVGAVLTITWIGFAAWMAWSMMFEKRLQKPVLVGKNQRDIS